MKTWRNIKEKLPKEGQEIIVHIYTGFPPTLIYEARREEDCLICATVKDTEDGPDEFISMFRIADILKDHWGTVRWIDSPMLIDGFPSLKTVQEYRERGELCHRSM